MTEPTATPTNGPLADIVVVGDNDPLPDTDKPVLIDLKHLDPKSIPVGQLSKPSGDFAMANFRKALTLASAGAVDAVTFSPFNKATLALMASFTKVRVSLNTVIDCLPSKM